MCYTREPHARQQAFADVVQPTTHEERARLAGRMCTELQLDVDVWIDDLGDASRATFGDLPSLAIVIDADGVIRRKLPWFDPNEVAAVLTTIAERRHGAAPEPAENGFLARLAGRGSTATGDDEIARHHRQAMLAWLVEHRRDHRDRASWLDELADDAPPMLRAFVDRQRALPRSDAPLRGRSPDERPPR